MAEGQARPWATIRLIGTRFEQSSGHGRTVPRGKSIRDHLRYRTAGASEAFWPSTALRRSETRPIDSNAAQTASVSRGGFPRQPPRELADEHRWHVVKWATSRRLSLASSDAVVRRKTPIVSAGGGQPAGPRLHSGVVHVVCSYRNDKINTVQLLQFLEDLNLPRIRTSGLRFI